jgi:hypothetical protein
MFAFMSLPPGSFAYSMLGPTISAELEERFVQGEFLSEDFLQMWQIDAGRAKICAAASKADPG